MRKIPRKLDRFSAFGGGASEEVTLVGESPLVLPSVYGGLKSLKVKGGAITQEGTPTPDDPKPILIGGKELKISADGVPYVEGSELVVSGKNLIDDSVWKGYTITEENEIYRIANKSQKLPPIGSTIYCVPFIDGVPYMNTEKKNIAVPYARTAGGGAEHIGINSPKVVGENWTDIFLSGAPASGDSIGKKITGYMVSYQPITAYEPYHEPTRLPLPLLIGDDEADLTKGEVVRKWGVVDLGAMNWSVYEGAGVIVSNSLSQYIQRAPDNSTIVKLYCEIFANNKTPNEIWSSAAQSISVNTAGLLTFRLDGITDIDTIVEILSGRLLVFHLATDNAQTITPTAAPLIKPTSVLTSYASAMEVTYKAKQKPTPWFEYVVGLNTSVDYSAKEGLTCDGLANIIRNSTPTHAIVIKLSASDYDKCASGGAWNAEISSALSTKPLVSLAK